VADLRDSRRAVPLTPSSRPQKNSGGRRVRPTQFVVWVDVGMIPFTLDQLEVLETIAQLGSFAKAARHLHRATSAVSYSVRTLEDALRVRLFDRSGRQAVLTPSGELALDAMREILRAARHLDDLGRQLKEGWEPHLHVVIDGVVPMAPVLRAVQRFSASASPTKLLLSKEHLSGVRRKWEKERAQLMVPVDGSGDAQTVAIPLAPIEMVLVAHPGCQLLRDPGPVTRAALQRYCEVLVADSGERDTPPPSHLACIGSPRVVEVPDFLSKSAAIAGGVGFGVLPMHLAGPALEAGELVRIQLDEGSSYTLTPHIMYRRHAPLGPGARMFVEALSAEGSRAAGAPQSASAARVLGSTKPAPRKTASPPNRARASKRVR
jgi:DNA-binding transcriptional LysR family regulator